MNHRAPAEQTKERLFAQLASSASYVNLGPRRMLSRWLGTFLSVGSRLLFSQSRREPLHPLPYPTITFTLPNRTPLWSDGTRLNQTNHFQEKEGIGLPLLFTAKNPLGEPVCPVLVYADRTATHTSPANELLDKPPPQLTPLTPFERPKAAEVVFVISRPCASSPLEHAWSEKKHPNIDSRAERKEQREQQKGR